MTAMFGYTLWLCSMMPELSMDAFFRLIGRSTRQHDLLEMFRFTVQSMANGTSPLKLGMMLAIVTGFLASRSVHPARATTLFVAGSAGLLGAAELLVLGGAGGMGTVTTLMPAIVSTFATFWWAVSHTLTNAAA